MNATMPDVIVALDVPDRYALEAALLRLPPEADFFKVGLELFCAEGPSVLDRLREHARRIFLDLKLHDIPRTVERAVRAASRCPVDWVTVHAAGGPDMIRAAVCAARERSSPPLRVIAVTVLTSLSSDDLRRLGLPDPPLEYVRRWTEIAQQAGADGVVCSAHEVAGLRGEVDPQFRLVVPGIRLSAGSAGDQKRVATPEQAVADGADALVIGRPLLEASEPRAAWDDILASMRAGLARRAAGQSLSPS